MFPAYPCGIAKHQAGTAKTECEEVAVDEGSWTWKRRRDSQASLMWGWGMACYGLMAVVHSKEPL